MPLVRSVVAAPFWFQVELFQLLAVEHEQPDDRACGDRDPGLLVWDDVIGDPMADLFVVVGAADGRQGGGEGPQHDDEACRVREHQPDESDRTGRAHQRGGDQRGKPLNSRRSSGC